MIRSQLVQHHYQIHGRARWFYNLAKWIVGVLLSSRPNDQLRKFSFTQKETDVITIKKTMKLLASRSKVLFLIQMSREAREERKHCHSCTGYPHCTRKNTDFKLILSFQWNWQEMRHSGILNWLEGKPNCTKDYADSVLAWLLCLQTYSFLLTWHEAQGTNLAYQEREKKAYFP